ncbi:MAG: hypothetical protein KAJ63_11475, partial [Methyloprofundus sp.]|nr:hypothetical protein [Methyloprofundus sp.]
LGNTGFMCLFIRDKPHTPTLTLRRKKQIPSPKIFSALALLAFLNACTSPSTRFHNEAMAQHFNVAHLTTPLFQHIIYSNNAQREPSKNMLHIYLDGDGTPWVRKYVIAKDPTSRNRMILDLMGMDRTPSILLGRPCYYGLYTSPECHPRYWTSHRYAAEVVHSMKEALIKWLIQHPQFKNITFIGYSGGGTLAMLLAPYFKQTTQVVTVAANLDIEQWALLHAYSPLTGSLNPITQRKLPKTIKQLHFAGALDKNTPATITKSYAATKGRSKVFILNNQAHCCWNEHWLEILAIIKTNIH